MRKFLLLAAFTVLAFIETKATVRYVNATATGLNNGTSWTNAFTSLQSAISATIPGDTIWVANGIYKPTTSTTSTARQIAFEIPTSVAVFGGFSGTETQLSQRNFSTFQTILSGDIGVPANSTDNSYNVVRMTSVSSLTRLDGFKIMQGNANGSASVFEYGGGIHNSGGSPTIANCFFSDNIGRTACIRHSTSGALKVLNCTFQNNTGVSGSAVFSANAGTALFSGCNINQNSAAIGTCFYLSNTNITTIDRCVISGNTASTFASVLSTTFGGGAEVYNSLIVGNLSAGATISLAGASSPSRIINCTIAHNRCTDNTVNDYAIEPLSATIRNCIIWQNTNGAAFQLYNSGNSTISDNLINGGVNGSSSNTFSFDPQFVSPGIALSAPFVASSYDYHLKAVSRAIDTGANAAISPLYTLDLDSVARTFGGRVDLGAYERHYCSLTPAITLSTPSSTICNGSNTTLTASGGTDYSWSTGAATSSISVSTAGNYKVVVGNAAGCRGVANQAIQVNNPAPFISGNPYFCPGASTTLTASGANLVSYQWNPGPATPSIVISTPGTYSVTATDNTGCTGTTSVTVTLASVPQPIVQPSGGGLTTGSFITYQWNLAGAPIPGATIQSYIPTISGVYSVTVTNGPGCSNTSAPYTFSAEGIDDAPAIGMLNVYPNPARDFVTIKMPAGSSLQELCVLNAVGEIVARQAISATTSASIFLDTKNLPSGIYVVHLVTATGNYYTQLSLVK